jgi:hypothetical protein
MIAPILNNPDDDPWIIMVGKYILNMGAIEATTRKIVATITGSDSSPEVSHDLHVRIRFIRKRFPRENRERHAWAMNIFGVGLRHVAFRNIIAHSPLALAVASDKTDILGIMNLTPNDPDNLGQLVTLEELKGRVDESSRLGHDLMKMQGDFLEQR